MHLKINVHGALEIKRKDTYKEVYCPISYGVTELYTMCSDNCALFKEPDETCDCLELCNGNRIYYNELIDER